jgi:hypothetical protein
VSAAIHRQDRPDMLDVAYAVVDFERRDSVRLSGVNALPGDGFNTRREIPVGVGCCLLLTAEALRSVGLFDESYFAYHEDVDWSLRAHRLNFQIVYEPLARVFHRGSTTTGALGEDRPNDASGAALPDLPNAEPLPWNPIRTYLGARNLIRLLRTYAAPKEKRAFLRSCAYEIPLEFLAILMQREGWLRLGRFGYKDAARLHFVDRHPLLMRPSRGWRDGLVKALAFAMLVPIDLFWNLPREIWRAHRAGRTAQFAQYLRGLRDGVLDRPIPLEDLGLR